MRGGGGGCYRQGPVQLVHLESAEVGLEVKSAKGVLDLAEAWPRIGPSLAVDVTFETSACTAEVTDMFLEGFYRVRELGCTHRQRRRSFMIVPSGEHPPAPLISAAAPAAAPAPPSDVWQHLMPCRVDVAVDLGPLAAAFRTSDSAVILTLTGATVSAHPSGPAGGPRPGSCGQICTDALTSGASSARADGNPPASELAHVLATWEKHVLTLGRANVSVLDVAAQRTGEAARS